jgi:L-amino acid N-acyltransferase YncA
LFIIRKMRPVDWEAAASIYAEGIETGLATFEEKVPSWEEWDQNHMKNCRFVIEKNSEIAGWTALSPVSARSAYRGAAEVSIYVSSRFRGLGGGERLLTRLITESEAEGIWTLQSVVFRENRSSLRLHEKTGFRTVGYREKIACLHGVWQDTVLMEKRSQLI